MRTRETGEPIDSAASTATDAIGAVARPALGDATAAASTLRKSTTTVSGSGRVATYGTGSVASMTSVALRASPREVMVVSFAPAMVAAVPAAREIVLAEVASSTTRKRATPLVT